MHFKGKLSDGFPIKSLDYVNAFTSQTFFIGAENLNSTVCVY